MLDLSQIDTTQAKYLQLADAVRLAIRQGKLLTGDSLPSVKQLSENLGINRHTVMKSFAELIAEGWIESKQRVGYLVSQSLPLESSQGVPSEADASSHDFSFRFVRSGMLLPTSSAENCAFNFAGGQPDTSMFPFAELKSHMSEVLSRPNLQQLGYGDRAGTAELIEQVEIYLRKKRAVTEREIIITNGSQEAMYIIAQLLLHAGDLVAVEALGYPPAMAAFKSAGADLIDIKQDEQGIVPEDLAHKIKHNNIRLIYLTPLHQYPTTVTLSVGRRMKIYQLAAKHNIPIIEDDYDHEFHYRCQPLAPMASNDPQQLVIYISSFSKIMFPGARIGLMAVSKSLAKAIQEYRMLICHKSNVLMQSALARWMQQGGFERHLRRTTRINHQRRDHAVALLNKLDLFDFEVPDGGMALWLKIKSSHIGADELMKKTYAAGIFIQDEGQFHLQKSKNKNQFIRIGYAGMGEQKFTEGMMRLSRFLNK